MTMGKSGKILSLCSVKELLALFSVGLFSCRGVGGAVEFLSVVLQNCQSISRVANPSQWFLFIPRDRWSNGVMMVGKVARSLQLVVLQSYQSFFGGFF